MSPNRQKHKAQYAALGRAVNVAGQSLDEWRGMDSVDPRTRARVKVMQLVKRHGLSRLERLTLDMEPIGE